MEKYFWLKLKRDYFKNHKIKILEAMPNGKEYSLFYLKLLVESLDHNGSLRFNDTIPYNEQMLSAITDTNIDIVRSAVSVLKGLELVEILDDGTIFMNEVQKMIGSASASKEAIRKQEYRLAQKDNNGTSSGTNCPIEYRNKNIEYRNKSIDNNNIYNVEQGINNVSKNEENDAEVVRSIINYLNEKCKTNYKFSTQKTRQLIRARLKEKFIFEDFKVVIDKKYNEWFNSEMSKYLRPETLFGTKFEAYLNQTINSKDSYMQPDKVENLKIVEIEL